MNLRRWITISLMVLMPLQGQAAASMTCHGSKIFAVPAVSVYSAEDFHEHGKDAGLIASQARDIHDHSQSHSPSDKPLQQPTGCAFCVASCSMSHALVDTHARSMPGAFESIALILGPSPRYSSVVLEGLLRPPRS